MHESLSGRVAAPALAGAVLLRRLPAAFRVTFEQGADRAAVWARLTYRMADPEGDHAVRGLSPRRQRDGVSGQAFIGQVCAAAVRNS